MGGFDSLTIMNAANQEHPAILLVDTRSASLRRLSDTLHRAGHVVIEAASFDDAKHALADYRPGVLISALRLAAFNGLHLVHLGRLLNPDLNAIIVSTDRDVLLHDEVHLVGATLLIEPLHIPALLTGYPIAAHRSSQMPNFHQLGKSLA
jgi:DNA-binding NtrC family response regulator